MQDAVRVVDLEADVLRLYAQRFEPALDRAFKIGGIDWKRVWQGLALTVEETAAIGRHVAVSCGTIRYAAHSGSEKSG